MADNKIYYRSEKSKDNFHMVNEDYVMFSKFSFINDDEIDVIALADGMGGMQDGDVASRAACEEFVHVFYKELMKKYITQRENFTILHYCNDIKYAAFEAMKAANQNVLSTAMEGVSTGTTLSVAILVGQYFLTMNVGDTPVYYYKASENSIRQIADIQTKAEKEYHEGKYKRYSREYYNNDYILTHYLGQYTNLSEDIISYHIEECVEVGDFILICSDGAAGFRKPEEIADILLRHEDDYDLALECLFQNAMKFSDIYGSGNEEDEYEDDQTAVYLRVL